MSDAVQSCPSGGRIEVVVLGNEHSPLPDAVVEIEIGGQVCRTKTNADGFASFDKLPGTPSLRLAMVDAALWQLAASIDLEEPEKSKGSPATFAAPEKDEGDGGGTYTCSKGEIADAIAARLGVPVPALQDVDGNAVDREIPMDDGVALTYPARRMRRDLAPCGKRHLIIRSDIPFRFVVRLRDSLHLVRAGRPYLLKVTMSDGSELPHREGVSDEEGRIAEKIPFGAAKGELLVDERGTAQKRKLRFTALAPVSGTKGVQERLEKLGFSCGGERGEVGEQTAAALRWFQYMAGLAPTGTIDDPTRAALVARYRW